MQPIAGWSGDLPGVDRWVRDLAPRQPSAPDSVFPQTIEFYVGQQNPVRQDEAVECANIEGDDLITRVRDALTRVLASLPKDRTMVSITIRATRIDGEGKEVPWKEAGEVSRQMTRIPTPVVHLPPPPTAAAPRAAPKIPPPPKPAEEDWVNEGGDEDEDDEDNEEEVRLPRGGSKKSTRERLEAYAQDPTMRRRRRKARMSAIDIVVTTLREENADFRSQQRYLIEQLAGSFERAFEIMGETLTARTTEMREARTDAVALQREQLKTERERAKSDKEAAVSGVKEQLKAEQRVSEAHKAGRAELIKLAEKMSQRAAASGTNIKPQSAGDRAVDRSVGLAEKVAEKVILGALDEGMGGNKKDGEGGGGGGNLDPSKMTPEEMGGVLAFLSPEARKRALLALAKQNPNLAQSLAGEVVAALDETVGPGNWGQDEDADGDDDGDDDSDGEDDDE